MVFHYLRYQMFGALLVATLLTACGGALAPESLLSSTSSKPSLSLVMTVDWEGEKLGSNNLAVMEKIREEFPEVVMVHYLNAAYYTKPDADPGRITAAIRRVLRSHDAIGLHIHSYKTLVEASGVAFRPTPVLFPDTINNAAACKYDCGFDVPLSAYNPEELRKITRHASDILDQQGFGPPRDFRAGAWMADQNVAEALAAEGFVTDASAVPASFISRVMGPAHPLSKAVTRLWRDTTSLSQPYERVSGLTEYPDNGALADYMEIDQTMSVIRQNLAESSRHPNETRWVVIGFHQETAADWQDRIRGVMQRVRALNETKPGAVRWSTFPH